MSLGLAKGTKRTYKPRAQTNSKKQALVDLGDIDCDKNFFRCFSESEENGEELKSFIGTCVNWIKHKIKEFKIDSLKRLTDMKNEMGLTRFQYFLLYFYGPWTIDWSQKLTYKTIYAIEQYDLNQGFLEIPGTIVWKHIQGKAGFKISMGHRISNVGKSSDETDVTLSSEDVLSEGTIFYAWCKETDLLHPKTQMWFPRISERIICFPEPWLKTVNFKNIRHVKTVLDKTTQELSVAYSNPISKPYNVSVICNEEKQVKFSFLSFKLHCPEYLNVMQSFLKKSTGEMPEELELKFPKVDQQVLQQFSNFMVDHTIDQNLDLENLLACLSLGMELSCKSFVAVCLELWMSKMVEYCFKDFDSFEQMWMEVLKWESDELTKSTLKGFFDEYVCLLTVEKFLHLWYSTQKVKSTFDEQFLQAYHKRNPLGLSLTSLEKCFAFVKDENFAKWLFLSVMFKSHPVLKSYFLSIFNIKE